MTKKSDASSSHFNTAEQSVLQNLPIQGEQTTPAPYKNEPNVGVRFDFFLLSFKNAQGQISLFIVD